MEPVSGQSDGTHFTGVWRHFPKGHATVQIPLSWLPGVLVDLEWPAESFKPPSLGGQSPDIVGALHPVYQMWEGCTLEPLNWHHESEKCRIREDRRSRRTNLQYWFKAIWVSISANLEALETVTALSHLDHMVRYNNIHWADMKQNFWKAQRQW